MKDWKKKCHFPLFLYESCSFSAIENIFQSRMDFLKSGSIVWSDLPTFEHQIVNLRMTLGRSDWNQNLIFFGVVQVVFDLVFSQGWVWTCGTQSHHFPQSDAERPHVAFDWPLTLYWQKKKKVYSINVKICRASSFVINWR